MQSTESEGLAVALDMVLDGYEQAEPNLLTGGEVAEPRRRSFAIRGLGLVFRHGTTYDEWFRDVRGLQRVESGVQWLLADALAYGEDRWGEDASQVLDTDIYTHQVQCNMANVARKIPRHRRREGVPFTIHQEVVALPTVEQDRLLDRAQEEGITQARMREQVRKRRQELAREAAAGLPAPELDLQSMDLRVGDATETGLDDESVDIILTSPVYGLDGSAKGDKYRVEDSAVGWLDLMSGFLVEARRVLRTGGRLIVNLPFDTSIGGYRPTYAQFVGLAEMYDFRYATTIIWHDDQLGKSIARGSVDSSSAPRVITPAEAIVVFSKGDWQRPANGRTSDIGHEEWLEWTNGLWQVQGETQPWEGFPAAMPTEIPLRLLKLFSYREDVILDPFGGSGTVPLVAWRNGRRVIALDIDPEQVASSKRRIAKAAGMVAQTRSLKGG